MLRYNYSAGPQSIYSFYQRLACIMVQIENVISHNFLRHGTLAFIFDKNYHVDDLRVFQLQGNVTVTCVRNYLPSENSCSVIVAITACCFSTPLYRNPYPYQIRQIAGKSRKIAVFRLKKRFFRLKKISGYSRRRL